MGNPRVVFEKANNSIFIVDCDLHEDNDDHLDSINSHKVLIYHAYNYGNGSAPEETKVIGNSKFELTFVSATYEYEETRHGTSRNKQDAFVYARHGGKLHKGWWFFSRFAPMSIQYSGEELDYKQQQKLTLAYVRSEIKKVENYKKDFMMDIGGKKNLYCVKHKSPLIASTLREETCVKCKMKKEFFRCCQFNCNICLCKKCADMFDPSIINFVPEEQNNNLTEENDIDDVIVLVMFYCLYYQHWL